MDMKTYTERPALMDMKTYTERPAPADTFDQRAWVQSTARGRGWVPNRGRGHGNNGASWTGEGEGHRGHHFRGVVGSRRFGLGHGGGSWAGKGISGQGYFRGRGGARGRERSGGSTAALAKVGEANSFWGHIQGNSSRGRGDENDGGSLTGDGERDGEKKSVRGYFKGRGGARGHGNDGGTVGKVTSSRGHFRGCQGREQSYGRAGYNSRRNQAATSGLRVRRQIPRKRQKENVQEMVTNVEVQEETCVCCNVASPKYKCPTCYLKYCSVACCKSHKEPGNCTKLEDSTQASNTTTRVPTAGRTPYLFPTANTVPLEKLTRLSSGENLDRLKHFLSSKRVRDLILRLDNVGEDNADSEFEAVMACAEFAEFAAFATQVLNGDEESDGDEE